MYIVYINVSMCMCAHSNRGSIITDNTTTKIIYTLTFKSCAYRATCLWYGYGLSVKRHNVGFTIIIRGEFICIFYRYAIICLK